MFLKEGFQAGWAVLHHHKQAVFVKAVSPEGHQGGASQAGKQRGLLALTTWCALLVPCLVLIPTKVFSLANPAGGPTQREGTTKTNSKQLPRTDFNSQN